MPSKNKAGCTCCGGQVLIWLADQDPGPGAPVSIADYGDLVALYEGMGLTVHSDVDWSSTIGDYSLVFVDTPSTEPSWWDTATGGGWTGRICILGENNAGGLRDDMVTWINSVSGATHGMTITGDVIDSGTCSSGVYAGEGTVETDDLTAGMGSIFPYNATSEVSGGTTLSYTETGAVPWLARNKVGTVDYVLSGDSNHLIDECEVVIPGGENEPFAENLWNVPV